MTSRSLLIIGAVWPEPTASAAGTRMLQLIKCFQGAGYSIRFACVTESQYLAVDLSTLDIETHIIKPNDSTVDTLLSNWQPSVVIFDRFYIEEQFGWRVSEQCPNAIKVLDTEDIHSLRQARQNVAKKQPESLLSHTPEFLQSEIGLRELAAIARCDVSLIISEVEMQLLSSQFPAIAPLLHYCPFMLDTHECQINSASLPSYLERQDIVWIGNFLHDPNWDAVRFLRNTIWPEVKKALPNVRMNVYGAYMPDKAKQLHSDKLGFLMLGRAENAMTVIQNARLLLAPIRFGAGLKGKLVEAMQCGTPSVCTEIAAEGIAGEFEWPGAVCESVDALIEKTIALYSDEKLWKQAQQLGEPLLQERFNAAIHEARLLQKIDSLEMNLDTARKSNLVGALLNHHHQRSTKYMSRWIETKNELAAMKASQEKEKEKEKK